MKNTRKLAILITALPLITAANGASVLLGGFEGINDNAFQSPTATGVTVTLTSSTGDITPGGGSFQSNPSTWGTLALDVATTDAGNRQIVQSGSPYTLTLTITNVSAAADVLLDSIHYWTKKDIANVGPPSATFAYTAGDLGAANSTSLAIANGVTPTDFALSGLLSDLTLAVGESATFTWTTDPPQDPTGNTGLRIDNFAISGEVIPEPSSAALLGLGCLALIRRRRK